MVQPGVFELLLATLPECFKRRLLPSFGVAVNLQRILVVGQAQRIQRIVDTRGVERGQGPTAAAAVVVQLRQIQTTRLLLRRLAVLGPGPAGQTLFFLGEEGVTLGLLARRFGFLGGVGLPRRSRS